MTSCETMLHHMTSHDSTPQELLDQRKQRQQQRQELGRRRSAASQNRMRLISQLAEEGAGPGKKSKRSKEDTFGMNDDDWNVYRAIVSGRTLPLPLSVCMSVRLFVCLSVCLSVC